MDWGIDCPVGLYNVAQISLVKASVKALNVNITNMLSVSQLAMLLKCIVVKTVYTCNPPLERMTGGLDGVMWNNALDALKAEADLENTPTITSSYQTNLVMNSVMYTPLSSHCSRISVGCFTHLKVMMLGCFSLRRCLMSVSLMSLTFFTATSSPCNFPRKTAPWAPLPTHCRSEISSNGTSQSTEKVGKGDEGHRGEGGGGGQKRMKKRGKPRVKRQTGRKLEQREEEQGKAKERWGVQKGKKGRTECNKKMLMEMEKLQVRKMKIVQSGTFLNGGLAVLASLSHCKHIFHYQLIFLPNICPSLPLLCDSPCPALSR